MDHFTARSVRWPMSLVMQIIGADIQACREIKMGDFPAKWMVDALMVVGHAKALIHPMGYLCPS